MKVPQEYDPRANQKRRTRSATVEAAIALFASGVRPIVSDAKEYTFVVENNADQRIVKIEVSEDGDEWAYFDIGDGIPSGKSATLARDESTNGSDCEWMFRATFSGGDVLPSDWVDFCEDDVVITFEFD